MKKYFTQENVKMLLVAFLLFGLVYFLISIVSLSDNWYHAQQAERERKRDSAFADLRDWSICKDRSKSDSLYLAAYERFLDLGDRDARRLLNIFTIREYVVLQK